MVISPEAFSFGPDTSSMRTFQGTFSAQDEPPPTTFRNIRSLTNYIRNITLTLILSGQVPTSLLPQISPRLMSTLITCIIRCVTSSNPSNVDIVNGLKFSNWMLQKYSQFIVGSKNPYHYVNVNVNYTKTRQLLHASSYPDNIHIGSLSFAPPRILYPNPCHKHYLPTLVLNVDSLQCVKICFLLLTPSVISLLVKIFSRKSQGSSQCL